MAHREAIRATEQELASSAPAPNFNFNVSHEGHYVVMASDPALLIGIDVSSPFPLRDAGPPLGDFDKIREVFANVLTDYEWELVDAAMPSTYWDGSVAPPSAEASSVLCPGSGGCKGASSSSSSPPPLPPPPPPQRRRRTQGSTPSDERGHVRSPTSRLAVMGLPLSSHVPSSSRACGPLARNTWRCQSRSSSP